MLNDKVAQTQALLNASLDSDELQRLSSKLQASGEEIAAWSEEFWKSGAFPTEIAARLAAANDSQGDPGRFPAYRYVVVRNSLRSLETLAELPVDEGVKSLMCDEYSAFAAGDADWLHFFDPRAYSFRALVGISLCRRFRAGLLDWETAGFPRSWFLRLPRRDVLRTAWFLLFKMRGRRPLWFPHNAFLRGKVQFMREREWQASLLLMAKSMQLQPGVYGILTGSWFYCPDTHRVTPHLGWTTRIFLENGALMTNTGPAEEGAGFLQGAPERERLYRAGEYRPTETILLWPRRKILEWMGNQSTLGPKG